MREITPVNARRVERWIAQRGYLGVHRAGASRSLRSDLRDERAGLIRGGMSS
jgi:hypothetical protein